MKLAGFLQRDVSQNILGDFSSKKLYLREVKLTSEKVLQLIFSEITELYERLTETPSPVALIRQSRIQLEIIDNPCLLEDFSKLEILGQNNLLNN
jgi:hypothetical protein